MTGVETAEIKFPVDPLEALYASYGTKDLMTSIAISQLVANLVDFGVSPYDISGHLIEAASKVKEEL